MIDIVVGKLMFSFPDGWSVSKYDEWIFYKSRFQKTVNGIKAVDLIAIDESKTAWLIEIKDYQNHPREKIISIHEEIALKVLYTLAAMIPCRLNAESKTEKEISEKVCMCKKLEIILHIELPDKHTKIAHHSIDLANLRLKLRQALGAIGRYPSVVSIAKKANVAWSVRRI